MALIDLRKKGIVANIISKDVLEPLVHLTNKQISQKTNFSIYVIKKSLVHHNLYKGKYYTLICENCGDSFGDFVNDKKFCSNHCKHSKQSIWNRDLDKTQSDILANNSKRMMGNKLGTLVNRSIVNREKLMLPNLNKEITYDKASMLEKNWLLQVDSAPGIIDVVPSKLRFQYFDEFGHVRTYHPDYEVYWETGLKWIVEVKGIATETDYKKIEQISRWAKENRCDYRLISTGMVRKNNWNTVFLEYKNLKIPTPEWVMMSWACTWSKSSVSPRLSVGAVICSMNCEEIFSYGFNGDEKGGSNMSTTNQPGQDGFIHAEENALLKLKSKESAKMFITNMPCIGCAKRIINSGNIKEVFYLRSYRDNSGVGLLIKAGIKVYHFEITNHSGQVFNDNDAYNYLLPAGLKDFT